MNQNAIIGMVYVSPLMARVGVSAAESGTSSLTSKQVGEGMRRAAQFFRQEVAVQGRWVSRYRGERLVGQPKFEIDAFYISSDVFRRNLEVLSCFLTAKPRQ